MSREYGEKRGMQDKLYIFTGLEQGREAEGPFYNFRRAISSSKYFR